MDFSLSFFFFFGWMNGRNFGYVLVRSGLSGTLMAKFKRIL